MVSDFQKRQILQLKKGDLHYKDAAIYTILLDLITDNGIEDVVCCLFDVCQDLEKVKDLTNAIEIYKPKTEEQ